MTSLTSRLRNPGLHTENTRQIPTTSSLPSSSTLERILIQTQHITQVTQKFKASKPLKKNTDFKGKGVILYYPKIKEVNMQSK